MSVLLDPSTYIRRLLVAEDVHELSYTQEIIARAGLPLEIIPAGHSPMNVGGEYPHNLHEGKRHLYLCNNKGHYFKPCPATNEYECCDYQVLNIGTQCPIDCVYCILQAYLKSPYITAFVNIDKMFEELDTALRREPDRFFRIGTGEFTDSLALERITGLSGKLISFLSGYDNVILELKTKSGFISPLENIDHHGRTILSWSLNSPEIIVHEEIRAASLQQRLDAAKRAVELGYHLSFHFDPIIYHERWREGYGKTIDMLFAAVPKESIVWISLGALRYLPSLKSIATSRFPKSHVFYHEFITGLDGKQRYFRGEREELYRFMVSALQKKMDPGTCLYFCMESNEIWSEIFGFTPQDKGGISTMLDDAALKAIGKY